jgi:hypothetical protein
MSDATLKRLSELFEEVPVGQRFTKELRKETLGSLENGSSLIHALNAMELDRRVPQIPSKFVKAGRRMVVDLSGIARLTFYGVEKSGMVSLVVDNGSESVPRGFSPGWPSATYHFDFKGQLNQNGFVEIEIYLGGISFLDRLSKARLFEWNGKTFKNATTAVDPISRWIRGKTQTLGTYIITQPILRKPALGRIKSVTW